MIPWCLIIPIASNTILTQIWTLMLHQILSMFQNFDRINQEVIDIVTQKHFFRQLPLLYGWLCTAACLSLLRPRILLAIWVKFLRCPLGSIFTICNGHWYGSLLITVSLKKKQWILQSLHTMSLDLYKILTLPLKSIVTTKEFAAGGERVTELSM